MLQQTPEWFSIRSGRVTASRIADLMAKTKTGYSASRQNYLAQLVAERLTGKPQDSFSNAAMQWGTDTEPFARAAYEVKTSELVTEVGFIHHPNIEMSGASPDGMVGGNLIEIKCPNTATHIDFLISKVIPTKYELQMLWQMDCTGSEWCDFVSFDPRMPEKHQLRIVKFYRDEERLKEIRDEVTKFLDEVNETVRKVEQS